jgi:hypothetical protein
LTFKEEDYVSGGTTATAVTVPGNGKIGVWPFINCRLETAESPSSGDFKKQNLNLIAGVEEAHFKSNIVDDDCLSNPSLRPVAGFMVISRGTVLCDPRNVDANKFAQEVGWSVEFTDPAIVFQIYDLNTSSLNDTLTLKSKSGSPVQIEIANLSIPSFDPASGDHPAAYGGLLKDRTMSTPASVGTAGPTSSSSDLSNQDHLTGHRALLKDQTTPSPAEKDVDKDERVAGGLGCQPTKMLTSNAT